MKKETQLANEIKKLQYQLSYSQHINKEMSQQLATLYDKCGVPPAKFRQVGEINVINTQTHLQQLYYVEPMLMCYEETVYLLKSQVDELREEGEQINKQVIQVVKQNTFLRKELEAKIELLKKQENMGINVNFLTLENKDLNERISILNSRNEYLARKNKELEDELGMTVKDKLGMYGAQDLKKVQQDSKEQHKLLETKNIQLSSELSILKNQLDNEKNIVEDYERKLVTLETDLTKVRNQLRVCRQQLENQQTLHDGTEDNLHSELQTVKQQLKVSQRKEQEMFTKSMSLQSELQDKNSRVHNLNVQNSQLQANNNNMLQMLESYEAKVAGLNKRIKKLEAEIKEMRQDGGETSKKADIAQWKLAQKIEQMERKQQQWKKQRARITQMWQQRLQSMRKSFQNTHIPTRE